MLYSRLWAGLLLCVLAVAKLLDHGAQETYLSSALGMDDSLARLVVWVVVTAEMLLGSLLLTTRAPGRTAILCLAVIGFGVVTALAVLLLPSAPACGCFGALGKATAAKRLVVSGVLVYLAADGLRPAKS